MKVLAFEIAEPVSENTYVFGAPAEEVVDALKRHFNKEQIAFLTSALESQEAFAGVDRDMQISIAAMILAMSVHAGATEIPHLIFLLQSSPDRVILMDIKEGEDFKEEFARQFCENVLS